MVQLYQIPDFIVLIPADVAYLILRQADGSNTEMRLRYFRRDKAKEFVPGSGVASELDFLCAQAAFYIILQVDGFKFRLLQGFTLAEKDGQLLHTLIAAKAFADEIKIVVADINIGITELPRNEKIFGFLFGSIWKGRKRDVVQKILPAVIDAHAAGISSGFMMVLRLSRYWKSGEHRYSR